MAKQALVEAQNLHPTDGWATLFGAEGTEEEGNGRHTRDVEQGGILPGDQVLNAILEHLSLEEREALSCGPYVHLRTQPSADGPQHPHVDFGPDYNHTLWKSNVVPLGALIAVQEGTTFSCWPGKFRDWWDQGNNGGVDDNYVFDRLGTDHTVIEVPVGWACVFRGDVAHMGGVYDVEHHRRHLHLQVEAMGREGVVSRNVDNEIVTHLLTNSAEPVDRGDDSATHQL